MSAVNCQPSIALFTATWKLHLAFHRFRRTERHKAVKISIQWHREASATLAQSRRKTPVANQAQGLGKRSVCVGNNVSQAGWIHAESLVGSPTPPRTSQSLPDRGPLGPSQRAGGSPHARMQVRILKRVLAAITFLKRGMKCHSCGLVSRPRGPQI